jgi:hypothetical protein
LWPVEEVFVVADSNDQAEPLIPSSYGRFAVSFPASFFDEPLLFEGFYGSCDTDPLVDIADVYPLCDHIQVPFEQPALRLKHKK